MMKEILNKQDKDKGMMKIGKQEKEENRVGRGKGKEGS